MMSGFCEMTKIAKALAKITTFPHVSRPRQIGSTGPQGAMGTGKVAHTLLTTSQGYSTVLLYEYSTLCR